MAMAAPVTIPQKCVLNLNQERLKLKKNVRTLLVSKFTSRETAMIEKLGMPCKSVEDLKVDSFDDELLRFLSEELQNPQPKPDPSIRAAVMKARFSGVISKASGKRKREDEEAERERKKRKEEEELRNIESRLKEKEAERQKKERKREMEKNDADRAMARIKLEEVEKNAVKDFRHFCWPEAHFRVMRDFESIIRSR